MRFHFLSFLLVASFATAQEPRYDHALALAAGRAYVESYLRLHPEVRSPGSDWSKATVEPIHMERQSVAGYVGVFVPDKTGSGGGHAYFEVYKGLPGHLFVVEWGYGVSLSDEVARFRELARTGRLPSFEYQDH
jgi:hypothetical protein